MAALPPEIDVSSRTAFLYRPNFLPALFALGLNAQKFSNNSTSFPDASGFAHAQANKTPAPGVAAAKIEIKDLSGPDQG